jgi:hypothetical protein
MRELRNAVSEAEVRQVFDLTLLRDVLSCNRGRRGVARLRMVVEEHDPRDERVNQELERRFLALCRRSGLPTPEVNVPIELADSQVEVDFVWRFARLVVETDSHRYHGTARAFESDRRRDQRLMLAGWRVARCTWKQVTREPQELAGVLRALLMPMGRNP